MQLFLDTAKISRILSLPSKSFPTPEIGLYGGVNPKKDGKDRFKIHDPITQNVPRKLNINAIGLVRAFFFVLDYPVIFIRSS